MSHKFISTDLSFAEDLRLLKKEYFDDRGINPTGDIRLYRKASIILGSWIVLLLLLVFGEFSSLIETGLCILFGLATAAIGFNIMHDGGHKSFSENKTINTIMVSTLNVLGGYARLWIEKHNVLHHTFTNIDGDDDDIELGVLARFHPSKKWYSIHRFQWIYVPLLLYPLGYASWIYLLDTKKFILKKIGDKKITFKKGEWKVFVISKLTHLAVFVGLPLLTHSLSEVLIGYGIVLVTTGFTISLVFQLAHVVKETKMVPKSENNIIPLDNKVHQVMTTANFGTKSKFLEWALGGLNFQIEHHLFPGVSHVHYAGLQPYVKELCRKHGIPYNENATFLLAVKDHIETLWLYGQKPNLAA